MQSTGGRTSIIAPRCNHEQAAVPEMSGDVLEQLQRRIVCPLKIVEEQDAGSRSVTVQKVDDDLAKAFDKSGGRATLISQR